MLDSGAKRRLTGAVVLVVLAVVFLPMLLEDEALDDPVPAAELRLPEPPPVARGPQAEIFPSIEDAAARAVSRAPDPDPAPAPKPEPEPEEELEPLTSQEPVAAEVPKVEAQAKPASAAMTKAKAAEVAKAEAAKAKAKADAKADAGAKPDKAKPAAPKPVAKGLGSWVVQVAALATPESAHELEQDLRTRGYPAYVEQVAGPRGTLWRVRVGPETERSKANALASDLRKRPSLRGAFVQKYSDVQPPP